MSRSRYIDKEVNHSPILPSRVILLAADNEEDEKYEAAHGNILDDKDDVMRKTKSQ